MMTEPCHDWFHHGVFSHRAMRSTVWTLVISIVWLLLIIFLSFLAQSPLQPVTCIISTLNILFSPSLFHFFIFLSVVVWSSVKHSQSFSMTPSVFHSWSKLLMTSLQPSISTSMALFSCQSTIMAFCFTRIAWPQYSSFYSNCSEDEESWCVSHENLFLLGCGAITGLLLGVRYHFSSDNCITFPVIYKEPTTQVKQKVQPLLINSVKQAPHILKYYYVLYLVSFMVITSSLPLSPINTSLFLAAMSITISILLINYTKLRVFSVFLTAPLPTASLEQILSSLSPSSPPLLHHLSLQALARLTATSSSARSAIFSLSQPGGHPHSWNTVSQSCLATLDSISSSITSLTSPKAPAISTPTPTPKPEPQYISSPGMRRLAPSFGAKMEEVPVPSGVSPAKQMMSSITNLLDRLKKQPGVAMLFKVQPEAGMRAIFCKSQAAIWSVDILSHLVAASITEDRFGVVQKELVIILTSLLTLDQKIAGFRKPAGTSDEDVRLKQELKAAVKAGLYRIAIQFGEHIQAIPMERELGNKMMNYQKFLE